MPQPGHTITPRPEFTDEFKRTMFPHLQPTNEGLAHEIALLRKEIAALREELQPVPSLILTGKTVLEAFERLEISNQ